MSESKLAIDHRVIRDWLVLLRTPRVGPATFFSLLDTFGDPQAVLAAKRHQLSQAGLNQQSIKALLAPDEAQVAEDLRWLEQPHAHILLWTDARYPPLLREIHDPPPLLFVYGDPAVLAKPQLAMVGSRNPSSMGRETAQEFARYLVQTGLVVTSGLALGIDAASHQGALLGGGATIAVAGTGLDRVYPARHRELAHQIADKGALISEFPTGTPPLASHFPRRNRLISGMSLGILVVEATLRSGSLITAQLGLEQGREVFAVPGSIHNPQARGCNALIRQGAKLVETALDIIEELPDFSPAAVVEPADADEVLTVELDDEYKKVLQSVGFEPTSVDSVVERSGLTADVVCSMLLVLELQGLIATTHGGHYCQTG